MSNTRLYIFTHDNKLTHFLLVAVCILFCISSVNAERLTCPDGTVQYTPCTAQQNVKITRSKNAIHRRIPGSTTQTSVLGKTFRRISTAQGLWEGFVAGSGTTHLKLVFMKDGSVLETRYIGSVTRKSAERPTKFKFISALPGESDWSWQIVALTV